MYANSWNSKDQRAILRNIITIEKDCTKYSIWIFRKTFANQDTVIVLEGKTAITTTNIYEPVILFLENISIKIRFPHKPKSNGVWQH